MSDFTVIRIPSTDPRLGRHVFHDERSRAFAAPVAVDRSTWHNKAVRVYDPRTNPNQPNGCCTAVAKAVQFNAVGNRRVGVVLNMDWVQQFYTRETQVDPFPGEMPTEDTGSNGLASCKVAQEQGEGGAYYWLFGGADEVVQTIMAGDVVSVGTRWDHDMFHRDANLVIHPGGGAAGGHQYPLFRYDAERDLVGGRCWWGTFRDFWIARTDLDALLADDGDAHVQARV